MAIEFKQNDFRGGLNLFDTGETIGVNQYALAYNVRNRTAELTPVKDANEDKDAPYGKKQGLFAFDKFLILFVDGLAYYKDIHADSQKWIQIESIVMDPKVEYIYTQAVPTSTENFDRKLESDDQVSGNATEQTIKKSIFGNDIGTPAGLICQDGINQPWIIFEDGSARKIQTYDKWTRDKREYVPIMTKMAYVDGILFGISGTDGRTLLRSVTGRPLDFVVNVDTKGEKGGDADTTSYAVTYNPITSLQVFSAGKLLAATKNRCFPIGLNYDKQYFNEPSFTNNEDFSAGVVNQYSFIDVLSDRCFIDTDGIRSFIASNQDKNEGRNSVFSIGITKIMEGIPQEEFSSAAIVFNDYALFAIATTIGPVIAVYEIKREQWVSIDDFKIGAVKQFAIADQSVLPVLYCMTADKVYKLYDSTKFAEAAVTFKSITTSSAIELKLNDVQAIFGKGIEQTEAIMEISINDSPDILIVTEPLSYDDRGIDNVRFNFEHSNARLGWSITPTLRWDNGAKLKLVQVNSTEQTPMTNVTQQANIFAVSNNIYATPNSK